MGSGTRHKVRCLWAGPGLGVCVSADLRVCTGTLPHGGIPCPRPGRPAGTASVPSAASLRVGIFHKPADQRVLTRFKLDLKGGRSVSEPRTVPRAPNGLARRGRVLWAELHTEFDFTGEPHRRVLVEDACREADLVDRLQRAVTKNDLRVKGSQGQPAFRYLVSPPPSWHASTGDRN